MVILIQKQWDPRRYSDVKTEGLLHVIKHKLAAATSIIGGGGLIPLLFLLFTVKGECYLNVQLIVCDQIINNEELRGHELGRVLNHITIPVIPYVLELHILLKIFNIPKDRAVDTHFLLTNQQGEEIGRTSTTVLRNYRADDQISGVDRDFAIMPVIVETGMINIRCFVDEKEEAWYPLTVRLQEEKLKMEVN